MKDKYRLNRNQKAAVFDNRYPYFLEAGAGTGKTHVLIEKLVHILENEEVSLDETAVITFTNKASGEISRRLQERLQERWEEQLNNNNSAAVEKLGKEIALCNAGSISTIHIFCERILRLYGPLIGISSHFSVSTYKSETREIVISCIEKNIDSPFLKEITQQRLIDLLTKMMEHILNKGLNLEEFIYALDIEDKPKSAEFKKLLLKMADDVISETKLSKQSNNILSINDLILECIHLFNVPKALKLISSKIKYLFIDEFQDTNYEQYSLVHKLIDAGVRVFMIGDPKQSIYSFRGADAANVKNIQAGFLSKKQLVVLSKNYRTDAELLRKINKIFSSHIYYNREKLDFPWKALSSESVKKSCNSPFEIKYREDVHSVIQGIVNGESISGKPISYEDIAVLCRSNNDIDSIAKELKRSGIPAYDFGKDRLFNAKEIIDTYKVLYYGIYKTEGAEQELAGTDYYKGFRQLAGENSFRKFVKVIRDAVHCIRRETILSRIYEDTHIMNYYRQKGLKRETENLLRLKEIMSDQIDDSKNSLLQFMASFKGLMIADSNEKTAGAGQYKKAVTVSTIHKAKGLEFPVVIIVNCDKELIRISTTHEVVFDSENKRIAYNQYFFKGRLLDEEYDKVMLSATKLYLEEELRIFYVGCTRAKKKLVLLSRESKEKVLNNGASWAQWALESLK